MMLETHDGLLVNMDHLSHIEVREFNDEQWGVYAVAKHYVENRPFPHTGFFLAKFDSETAARIAMRKIVMAWPKDKLLPRTAYLADS